MSDATEVDEVQSEVALPINAQVHRNTMRFIFAVGGATVVTMVLALAFFGIGYVMGMPQYASNAQLPWHGTPLYIATEEMMIHNAWEWNEAHQQAMLHSFTNAVLVSVQDGKYHCCQSRVFLDTPATAQLLARHNCHVVNRASDCPHGTRPVMSVSPPGNCILRGGDCDSPDGIPGPDGGVGPDGARSETSLSFLDDLL